MKPVIKCNDNIEELKKIHSDSIDLVYIDPPFNTGKHQGDYDDKFDSMNEYINFIKPRIKEIHRILKSTGSIYLHSDKNASHYLKVMLDEMFGMNNFLNDISWQKYNSKGTVTTKYNDLKDSILFYKKGNEHVFHIQKERTRNPGKYTLKDERGYYRSIPLVMGKSWKKTGSKTKRRMFNGREVILDGDHGWKWSQEKIDEFVRNGGQFTWSKNGIPRYKKYLDEGIPLTNIWLDMYLHGKSDERTGYATQKPESLLERIIISSSNPGDTILDAFAGSGTTCAVASRLGRRSICIDQNPKACKIMEERLS